MKAALNTLPTELVKMIMFDYGAEELLYVSRVFYDIGIEEFCTGELYSPKTLSNGVNWEELHDYYVFITRMNPGSLYTTSITEFYLNLDHFIDRKRLDECFMIADFISYFPNLTKLELTLEKLLAPEDVSRILGESSTVTDLTIRVELIDDVSLDTLAQSLPAHYPKLATLRLHRPDLVCSPGLDLDRQERFIAKISSALKQESLKDACKPIILFKNHDRKRYGHTYVSYSTVTYSNYIHIYKWNNKAGYKEATKSKSKALAEYYPECVGNGLGNINKKKNNRTGDPLTRHEYDMLDDPIQRAARIDNGFRDEIRCAIDDRDRENARYRYYSVDEVLRERFGIDDDNNFYY